MLQIMDGWMVSSKFNTLVKNNAIRFILQSYVNLLMSRLSMVGTACRVQTVEHPCRKTIPILTKLALHKNPEITNHTE